MSETKQQKTRSSVGEYSTLQTIIDLWPYIWPGGRPDLKSRVIFSVVVLLLAKVVTVLVPYSYKWATDALTNPEVAPSIPIFITVPVMLIIGYGIGRILMIGLSQLRDALFVRVGQYAVRQLGFKTFGHLHNLSLRFHLQRRTGGLSRIIERGVKESKILFALPY